VVLLNRSGAGGLPTCNWVLPVVSNGVWICRTLGGALQTV
jgi:hypothetical protein